MPMNSSNPKYPDDSDYILPAIKRRTQQSVSQTSSMSTPQSTTVTKESATTTPNGTSYQAAVQRRLKKKSQDVTDDNVMNPKQQ